MRHIKVNKITSVTASSENANYPDDNLLDTHPSKPWQASSGINVATITAEVNYGVSDIAIFGTNAQSATVTASDPNEISWGDDDEWGDSDTWANTTITTPSVTAYQRSTSKALWLQLADTIDRPAELDVVLTSVEGSTVYAGVMQSSIAETYGGQNPRYGLAINPIDTSISAELSNGGRYYKKRNVLRSFELEAFFANSDAFNLIDFYQEYGQKKTAWRITDLASNEWVVYGYIVPAMSYDTPTRSVVNITLTEVL